MEELRLVVAHGVFVGAELGQEVFESEAPEGVAIGLGAGQVEVFDAAEVVGIGGADHRNDLPGEVVGREAGRLGDGDLVPVGFAVLGVEGEAAAGGFCRHASGCRSAGACGDRSGP